MRIGDAWVDNGVVTAVERSRSNRSTLIVWTYTRPDALEVYFDKEEDAMAELNRVVNELESSND